MWGVVDTGSKVPEYKLVLWLLHKLHTGVDMLGVLTFITVVHRRSLEVLLLGMEGQRSGLLTPSQVGVVLLLCCC